MSTTSIHLLIRVFLIFLPVLTVLAQNDPRYSVYLIGDGGEPQIDSPDPVFTNLKKQLDQEGENAAIIFLGDNVYHNGLPPEDRKRADRQIAEKKLLVQLAAVDDFNGKTYFIPGNHDWNDARPDGIDYIHAQERFVEMFLDRGDVLIPDHGCPGPAKKNLSKNIILLALDSQWWLHPHTNEQSAKSTCKNKNYDDILQELKEHIEEEEDKFIIIALHHPIYSDGTHNGYFTIKDHIFPLTGLNEKLWLPLPVIGSLYAFYRTTFGSRQDMPHPLYQNLRQFILEAIHNRKNIFLVSGHEHNLQYFLKDNNHFIKSGSGSKTSPLPMKTEALYSSAHKGYARLEFYDDREVRLKYFTFQGTDRHLSYDEAIIPAPPTWPDEIEPYTIKEDQINIPADPSYDRGGFHNMIAGKLYRRDWAMPVSFITLNLSSKFGGLTPVKAGGGMSSLSVRLMSGEGEEFVLRSVRKGVKKVVPREFRNTVIEDIFQDQIAASQPYGALAVPTLARAAQVYHTTPELVYLPSQPGLGDFNDVFGNSLYLLERRPTGNELGEDNFGNSRKIISYSKMMEKIRQTPKHHIHQEQVLRSRILDFYLGDWDRHDDQWRWASFSEIHIHDGEEEEVTFYEPIPRDRDQVFFKYQGLLPWISKILSPELRKFQSFGPEIENIAYLGYNARHFDRSFLNEMDRDDWLTISEEIKTSLTDEIIAEAVAQLPEPIFELRGEEYDNSLRKRRDNLVDYSLEYYDFLAKYVDVVGTHKRELFEVVRKPDNTVQLHVHKLDKKGNKEELLYDRTFLANETQEIRLYGLDGEDHFELMGTQNSGPLIRIIGGQDRDYINNRSDISDKKHNVIAYDSMDDNEFTLGAGGLDRRSDNYRVNAYDRKEFDYNKAVGLFLLGYNPDDGLRLSYRQKINLYGFRKQPFKAQHHIKSSVALGSKEINLGYELQLADVTRRADFNLQFDFSLPSDVENFFGLTNNIDFALDDFEELDFFRYRQTEIYVKPALEYTTHDEIHDLQVGPYYLFTDLHENGDRFIGNRDLSLLSESVFRPSHYVGFDLHYQLYKVDNEFYPTSGINFIFNPSFNYQLSGNRNRFTRLHGSLTVYNYLFMPKPWILATRLAGGINWGDFSYFQAHYAGGESSLRSFRQNRFGGKSAFALSNDLRIPLFKVHNPTLPFSVGMIGAFDHGRVWNKNSLSNNWHTSYGGGLWINLFDILPLSFYYMTSNEGESSFIFKFGFAL